MGHNIFEYTHPCDHEEIRSNLRLTAGGYLNIKDIRFSYMLDTISKQISNQLITPLAFSHVDVVEATHGSSN